jgi:uncharacterized cupin superfamily protein
MRTVVAVVTGLPIMAGWTVAAQEKGKAAKEEPNAKSGHETMDKGAGGSSDAAKIARAMSAGTWPTTPGACHGLMKASRPVTMRSGRTKAEEDGDGEQRDPGPRGGRGDGLYPVR